MDVDKEVDKFQYAVELQIQSIVRNVLKKCETESQNKNLHAPLAEVEERTSYYTGYPKEELYKLEKNFIDTYESNSESYDLVERILVIKALLFFYSKRMFPKYEDIYLKVMESFEVHNGAHFRYKLTQMGFDYRKTTTGYVLAEDMKLSFQRFHYLKKIKQFRRKEASIYYIDERVINEELKFEKPNFDKMSPTENATNLLYGFYFYHVFSDHGIENYLFTNKKSKETYLKWVSEIALKIMKPGSLIVIDDHFLHGNFVDETITRYHSKSEMVNWLTKNNIPCSATMRKAELYDIISKCVKLEPNYNFDKFIKALGFEVLRLPHGCKNLSPLSLFWKEMTTRCAKDISVELSPEELEEKLLEIINKLHKSDWKQFLERIIYWEDQFLDIDASTETSLDKFCKFDVHNIENRKIPEHFYAL